MAYRFSGPGQAYEGLVKLTANGPRWTGKGRFAEDKLAEPLSWRKPERIFVDSMSDLFFEEFTNEQIAAVFGVMAAAHWHTFMVLTKRAKRMREWFIWVDGEIARSSWVYDSRRPNHAPAIHLCMEYMARSMGHAMTFRENVSPMWPLPNVMLGISAENQDAFDERWPDLEASPAVRRFISAEPLIGGINAMPATQSGNLHMVIAGCESGPRSRPCDDRWLAWLRDQCLDSGVAYFLKQAFSSDRVTAGDGSKRKPGGLIGAPYLDGKQWLNFPR